MLQSKKVPDFHVILSGPRPPRDVDIRSGPVVVKRNPDADDIAVTRAIQSQIQVARWRFGCAGYGSCCPCEADQSKRMLLR
jgi:hypothetical protein